MSVSSYILHGKKNNKHWIHWYCKCVLGIDLCSFVKSIGHSPFALLHWACHTMLHFISFLLHLYPFVLSTAFGKLHVTSLFLLRDLAALSPLRIQVLFHTYESSRTMFWNTRPDRMITLKNKRCYTWQKWV